MTKPPVTVTDHAILRWLEREHDIDVEAIREHLAGLAANGARLGAAGVKIGKVKLVLRGSVVITAYKGIWPSRGGGE
ncbi:hypothetical protein [Mesorhizobium australicum]|uniref:Uncharacterized protein n=1 Tax=Mesorhizobium australicum TaxID=536018 RepID=A0A1X7NY35_9HYPH|nr:hypothetical protein [Mesorhizobium australicum]SMH42243.1 hypothetical protein SAMN02982922_2724 [Mesorhizobium australicum]